MSSAESCSFLLKKIERIEKIDNALLLRNVRLSVEFMSRYEGMCLEVKFQDPRQKELLEQLKIIARVYMAELKVRQGLAEIQIETLRLREGMKIE